MVEPVPSHSPEDDPERLEGTPSTDLPETSAADVGPGHPRDLAEPDSVESESGPESGERTGGDPAEDSAAGTEVQQRGTQRKQQRSFWKELPILIAVALVLAFLIQYFLARVYMIPSGSMEQTLHGCPGCTGDRIVVDKVTYAFTDPEPGDVVVFRGPEVWLEDSPPVESSGNAVARFFQNVGSLFGLAPPDERDFVKRIIATGGQTVECCDDQNRVVVDGEPLHEPYIHWEGKPVQAEFDPVTVPEDAVWVMGDNRNNSADSRYQGGGGERGTVPVDHIIGKARFIVLPPSRWGGVSDHNPQEDAKATAMGDVTSSPDLPHGVHALAAWPAVLLGRRVSRALRERSDEYGDGDECWSRKYAASAPRRDSR